MKNADTFGAEFDVLRHYINTDFDTVRAKCLFVFHRFVSTETSNFPPTQQFRITHTHTHTHTHTKNSVFVIRGRNCKPAHSHESLPY